MDKPLLYGEPYYIPPEIFVEVTENIPPQVSIEYLPNILLTSKVICPEVSLDQSFFEVSIPNLSLVSSVDIIHTEVSSVEIEGAA
jgi:hypothetical protein